jgi:hypothetical protein
VAAPAAGTGNFKDLFLSEIGKSKGVLYNTVVAQAQKVDVTADRVTFVFSQAQRTIRDVFEQNRTWLEGVAQRVSGRRISVVSRQTDQSAAPAAPIESVRALDKAANAEAADQKSADRKSALREQALADSGVQALLEVFPAEIRDVEEM